MRAQCARSARIPPKTGAQCYPDANLDYIDSSDLMHNQSILTVVTDQYLMMAAFEACRVNGGPPHEGLHLLHPGEAIDPLTLADGPDTRNELQVKQIEDNCLPVLSKNNRLTVLSVYRYCVQASATVDGLVENLAACYGPERNERLDPFYDTTSPDYLTGGHSGDYGWDGADQTADSTNDDANREAVLIHARWAMLDTLGCLTPAILAKYAGVKIGDPVCFKAGTQTLPGGRVRFLGGYNLMNAPSMLAVVTCQYALQGTFEAY